MMLMEIGFKPLQNGIEAAELSRSTRRNERDRERTVNRSRNVGRLCYLSPNQNKPRGR